MQFRVLSQLCTHTSQRTSTPLLLAESRRHSLRLLGSAFSTHTPSATTRIERTQTNKPIDPHVLKYLRTMAEINSSMASADPTAQSPADEVVAEPIVIESVEGLLGALRGTKREGRDIVSAFATQVKQGSADCAILPSDLIQQHVLFNLSQQIDNSNEITSPGADARMLIFDARSPSEYAKGHIPSSISLPLFSDEERAMVGKRFKSAGRDPTMRYGLSLVAPKLDSYVETVRGHLHRLYGADVVVADCTVTVYCWRGGLRSSSIAWLLRNKLGVQTRVVEKGYKGFRTFAMDMYPETCSKPKIAIIGGRTGAGKTRVLLAMREQGMQVLDLEGLANHNGSAFGAIGRIGEQPSTEQYQNDVAIEWLKFDPSLWTFIEDEGPHVGLVTVPRKLYELMREAPLIIRLLPSFDTRVGVLVEDYAGAKAQISETDLNASLGDSIKKLLKKLGGQRVKDSLQFLENGDFESVARIMLSYYDKLYDKHVANHTGTGAGAGKRAGHMVDITDCHLDGAHEQLDLAKLVQLVRTTSDNFVIPREAATGSGAASASAASTGGNESVVGVEKVDVVMKQNGKREDKEGATPSKRIAL